MSKWSIGMLMLDSTAHVNGAMPATLIYSAIRVLKAVWIRACAMALSNWCEGWQISPNPCVTEIQAIKNRQARFQEKPKILPFLEPWKAMQVAVKAWGAGAREIGTWTKIEKGLSNQHLNSQRKIRNVFLEPLAFAHSLVLLFFWYFSSLSWGSKVIKVA